MARAAAVLCPEGNAYPLAYPAQSDCGGRERATRSLTPSLMPTPSSTTPAEKSATARRRVQGPRLAANATKKISGTSTALAPVEVTANATNVRAGVRCSSSQPCNHRSTSKGSAVVLTASVKIANATVAAPVTTSARRVSGSDTGCGWTGGGISAPLVVVNQWVSEAYRRGVCAPGREMELWQYGPGKTGGHQPFDAALLLADARPSTVVPRPGRHHVGRPAPTPSADAPGR